MEIRRGSFKRTFLEKHLSSQFVSGLWKQISYNQGVKIPAFAGMTFI